MESNSIPILFPMDPTEFWIQIRTIVHEEMIQLSKSKVTKSLMSTPGLTQKPLYKISELCLLFNITRPTIYEWIKDGKLRPVKIRSRVFFLGIDIQELLKSKS